MPVRKDINKVVILGSGPLSLAKLVNLTIQVHKPVRP